MLFLKSSASLNTPFNNYEPIKNQISKNPAYSELENLSLSDSYSSAFSVLFIY